MSLLVRTTLQADIHSLELDLWWREHRPLAPDLFEEEIAAAFELIAVTPFAGKAYKHPQLSGVRRILLRTTKNHVYYVPRSDHVLVLDVWGAVKGTEPLLDELLLP